ncbi:MAG: hypothetical protein AB9M53_05410 [Leptothrix sp. (in: b-proteobacteria)]
MSYPFSGILVRYQYKSHEDECITIPNDSIDRSPQVDEGQDDVRDELHVNLWEIGEEIFLDIGIMIFDSRVERVIIDCPWRVAQSDLSDLGSQILGEQAVTAIFNESIEYTSETEAQSAKIKFNSGSKKGSEFEFQRLDQNSLRKGFKYNDLDGMVEPITSIPVLLKAPTTNKSSTLPARYIRFRISNVPTRVYSTLYKQKDKNILSSTNMQTIVDFRINVRRGVPESILIHTDNLFFPKFKKIHLFGIFDRERELIFEGQGFKACRSLEDEKNWADYIHNNSITLDQVKQSIRKCLGYQWSGSSEKNSPVQELTVLARFSQVKSDRTQVIRFMVIAFLVGAIGNGVWNVLEELVKIFTTTEINETAPGIVSVVKILAILFILLLVVTIVEGRLVKKIISFLWRFPIETVKNINKKMQVWK